MKGLALLWSFYPRYSDMLKIYIRKLCDWYHWWPEVKMTDMCELVYYRLWEQTKLIISMVPEILRTCLFIYKIAYVHQYPIRHSVPTRTPQKHWLTSALSHTVIAILGNGVRYIDSKDQRDFFFLHDPRAFGHFFIRRDHTFCWWLCYDDQY